MKQTANWLDLKVLNLLIAARCFVICDPFISCQASMYLRLLMRGENDILTGNLLSNSSTWPKTYNHCQILINILITSVFEILS